MVDDPQITPDDSIEENIPQAARKVRLSPAWRLILSLVGVILIAAAGYLLWQHLRGGDDPGQTRANASQGSGTTLPSSDATQEAASMMLLPYATPTGVPYGIRRILDPQTIIPTRPREDVITYTVQMGDNLFAIADNYNLHPETILWGNYATLKDNPEILQPDQVLNILPVNGVYYQWQEGDTLTGVASIFKVKAEDILNYMGNHIDLTAVTNGEAKIEPGTWIIIPGGTRPLKDWGPPPISRANPAVARYYGPGSCGAIYEGAVGTGAFVWPTTEHLISGYHFTAIHPAIDIGGHIGNAVYAADSGVVVYAGWSNYGYGNLVVIDHGNGWQTAYAHLSAINVICGQSVSRGIMIAALGSTGNSTGPHLHFEMSINGAKVNRLDYVQ